MRLLNTKTHELVPVTTTTLPSYAILSHCWSNEEVTYRDLIRGHEIAGQKAGYGKIAGACAIAADNGHSHLWIDSCCIDKSSSAELSEAINSMFQWYQKATICYAYLEDVYTNSEPGSDHELIEKIQKSRWFTRGWTLQELIAPSEVIFFSRNWQELGMRSSLAYTLSKLTSISSKVLMRGPQALEDQSVAKKMSWAAKRETTRPEDIAYCLLGLFDVHMPLLYGEGETKAFIRLQEEIVRTSTDHSILAWTPRKDESLKFRGAFAVHPDEFATAGNIVPLPFSRGDHSIVERGLQMRLKVIPSSEKGSYWGILSCQVEDNFTGPVGIALQRMYGQAEDYLVRHPVTTPQTINNARIRAHAEELDYKQEKSIENISEEQIKAMNEVRPEALRKIEGKVMMIWKPEAFTDPLSRQIRTIFIPKYPKAESPECQHLQVNYSNVALHILNLQEHWNPLSNTILLRDIDKSDCYGAFLAHYKEYKCTFLVAWIIDPTNSRASVFLPETPESKREAFRDFRSLTTSTDPIMTVQEIKDLVDKVSDNGKIRSARQDKWLDPIGSDKAYVDVEKVFEMGRPVWRLKIQVSLSLRWVAIKEGAKGVFRNMFRGDSE